MFTPVVADVTITANPGKSAQKCGDPAEIGSFIRPVSRMTVIIDGRAGGRRCIRKGRVMN
jgi:hypothetical protein